MKKQIFIAVVLNILASFIISFLEVFEPEPVLSSVNTGHCGITIKNFECQDIFAPYVTCIKDGCIYTQYCSNCWYLLSKQGYRIRDIIRLVLFVEVIYVWCAESGDPQPKRGVWARVRMTLLLWIASFICFIIGTRVFEPHATVDCSVDIHSPIPLLPCYILADLDLVGGICDHGPIVCETRYNDIDWPSGVLIRVSRILVTAAPAFSAFPIQKIIRNHDGWRW